MAKSMFSDKIVESDAFLDMPLSAQALYFHLGMNADNDGFVQPKKTMRMVNAANDDLQILIAKRFILVFESGVAVAKHWWINNTKRADRYAPTTYQNELTELVIKPNKAYSRITTEFVNVTDGVSEPETEIKPNGNQWLPQVHIQSHVHSSSSISNSSSTTRSIPDAQSVEPTARPERVPTEQIDDMLEYWQSATGLKIRSEVSARRSVASLVRQHGIVNLKRLVDGVVLALDDQYAPRISSFASLDKKQDDLIVWGRKKGKSNGQRAVDLTT
jgi:hypothetical protein